MDIRRLEAFGKVFELGSFSKAGQDLLLSQPTISAHVISLEQELGTQLFDRLGRTILPTQAGEILYRYATSIFFSIEAAKSEINLLLNRVAGSLILGASTIPATYLLPGLIASFIRLHPDVRLQLKTGDSGDIIASVLGGNICMGVVGAVSDEQDLVFAPFASDEIIVVASQRMLGLNALLGAASSVRLQDLAGLPWVLREQGSGTRKAFENAIAALGQDIRSFKVAVEAQSTEALLQCALQGIGLCAVSNVAAEQMVQRGDLIRVHVDTLHVRRDFFTVQHAKRHVFPVLRYFQQFLVNGRNAPAGDT